MADKIVAIKFEVNSADAVEDINKVTKATDGVTAASSEYEDQLNDTKKATESFKGSSKQFEDQLKSNSKATEAASLASNSFEEQLKEIKKTIDGANVDELEDAIKQYKNIAIIAGQTSPIGREAIMEASALKDKIEDLETAVSIAQRSGTQLQGALQLGSGIAAGYGAVQGVMALVGSESEDLQKTLVKLQAVQATLASVEEIRAVLQKESALRITAVTIAEKARAAATAVSTFVTTAASTAMGVFRLALIGTGIGAFIVALGFLVANFDKVKNAIMNNTEGFQTFKKVLMFIAPPIYLIIKAVELLRDNMDKVRDTFSNFLPILDSVSAKSLENAEKIAKAAQIEKDAVENRYNFEIEKARAAGKETEDLEISKFNAVNERLKKEKEAIRDQVKATKEVTDEQKDRYKEISAEILANDQAVEIKKIEIAKKAEDKRKELEKETEDKRKKAAEEKTKEEAAELKRKNDERRALEKQLAEELIDDKIKIEKEAKRKEAENLAISNLKLLLILEERAKQDQIRRDKEKAKEQELQDTKIMLAWQGANLINELMQLTANKSKANAERAFKINKAYQLAVAINDGYKAVLSTYAETKGGPVLKGIAAALAGGFAAVQISKIAQSKFDSSKFDNTKAPGGEIPLTSAAPTQTQAPQTPGRVSNLTGSQTTTVKAIVVESDITTTQKRINSIQELAKI